MAKASTQRSEVEPRKFEGPVAWLLGRQLIGSLKGTLLFTAFGNKIDPRDWMEAQAFPEPGTVNGDETEFWFDYVADTGDGMKATYSVAYLSAGDLWINPANKYDLPQGSIDTDMVTICETKESSNTEKLPRGQFLMVGGDTTYHLADYPNLANRFQTPFSWATNDRGYDDGKNERPLYGIPGNHDYYDLLDGFRRQFRKPIRPDVENPEVPMLTAQLAITGLRRKQQSSYVALRLPWDWWFWGLDTELGLIDERQRTFFETVYKPKDGTSGPQIPDKLIVATCAPTTVFGKYAGWEDEKAAQTFYQLNLPWHFWTGNSRRKETIEEVYKTLQDEMSLDEAKTVRDKLEQLAPKTDGPEVEIGNGQCRLDISGDVHLYARYWGPQSRPASENVPASDHYASVVSGLGGAFHHPSDTSLDQISEQALYPNKTRSRIEVAEHLFWPISIWQGGLVWLLGFLVAFTIYFSLALPPHTKPLVKSIFTSQTQKPETIAPATASPVTQFVESVILMGSEAANSIATPILGLVKGNEHAVGWICLSVSLLLMIFATKGGRKFFRIRRLRVPNSESMEDRKQRTRNRQRKLQIFIGLNAVLIALGFLFLRAVRADMSKFELSMLVLFTWLVGLSVTIFCLVYSEWLFEKAYKEYVSGNDWNLVYVTAGLGLVGVSAGLWLFGKPYIYVVNDLIFAVVVLGMFLGLIALAYFKGGELLVTNGAKVRAAAAGLWHALLQILVPLLIVGWWRWWSLLTIGIVSIIAYFAGKRALAVRHPSGLSTIWIVYGGIVLGVCFASVYSTWPQYLWLEAASGNTANQYGSWPAVIGALLAGAVGALNSCVWFGWYLAVCFIVFRGHNNEVGGAARIEKFKQFIRFRVTKDTLTGYVIAVDDVSMIGEDRTDEKPYGNDGRSLNPKLIDVFTLSVKGTTSPAKQKPAA